MNKTLKENREMKDSGIEWLGEIPKSWEIRRLRYLVNIKTGSNDTIDAVADGAYPFYVRSPKIERINTYTYDGEAILMAGDGVGAGKVFHYVNGKFSCHQRVYNLHQLKDINGKFLYYYLKENFSKEVEKGTAKSTVDSIRLPMIKDFTIVLPPLDEQQAIANYLDKQVGKIDELITDQNQAIENWKAYKQSLITETVTKGLNSNSKMKDSGIEWIGEIPKHWEIEKIKNKFLLRKEVNLNEDALLLSLFTHIGVKPRCEMEEKGNKATTVINYSIVKQNDIIVNKLLAWMGAIAISDYEGVCSPDYDVYTLRDKNNCAKYYHYLFRTDSFKGECYRNGKGIMLMRLRTYYQEFKNIYIPKIPISEQQAIADFLDEKCSKIDQTIEQKQVLIQQLEEYKQSLIYECVTGKRCVL